MPAVKMSAAIRTAMSAGETLNAAPTISGTATAPAYMPSTC